MRAVWSYRPETSVYRATRGFGLDDVVSASLFERASASLEADVHQTDDFQCGSVLAGSTLLRSDWVRCESRLSSEVVAHWRCAEVRTSRITG